MSSGLRYAVLPLGFRASGFSAHIKKSGKLDLALIYSDRPAIAEGVFTSNKIKAAPVELCIRTLRKGTSVQAIIVNSGNANCMTGRRGLKDAQKTAELLAQHLKVGRGQVLVSSTGIIGRPLPIEKIEAALPFLVKGLSRNRLSDAALAILTTDTFVKIAVRKIRIGGKAITISGIAKGAGMIAPQLKHASMLAYVVTDAVITKKALRLALQSATQDSFNAITIDGCMSTNDTLIALANAAAYNKVIKEGSKAFRVFASALKNVCLELAKMIVLDAEGATKFIKIDVSGAKSDKEANGLAMSVANSNLFKCAMFAANPNWGRIAAALGSIDSCLEWQKLDISLNSVFVFNKGRQITLKNRNLLKGKRIDIKINLNKGKGHACAYTSDLTYEYVRINAEYT